jgi:hypothetical protein
LQWFKDAKERQSEPVAWMSVELNGRTVLATYEFETAIPLYTHPAKTLTDEEIDVLVHEYNCIDDYPHEFVRACIRKAQEK